MSAPPPIVVVSGLPRAGTSLLMQMLAAGGLPLLADDGRAPDESNPKGYLEWQGAKHLPQDPGAIRAARGRAVKVIAALLPSLPESERYRVLFAERDAREIDASQRAMLARQAAARGTPPLAGDELDPAALEAHVERIRAWLAEPARRDRFPVLRVRHGDVLRSPREAAARIAEFLAPTGVRLDPASMAAAVDPVLYRARVTTRGMPSGAGVR
ncbi:MAG: sulfotransferase family protein [Deltaproteobacteria bacterium]|nr:sulfotransferase family protein [Deltaproteobacteria bacterium]